MSSVQFFFSKACGGISANANAAESQQLSINPHYFVWRLVVLYTNNYTAGLLRWFYILV